ncbi:hypothetical protein [Ornithinimicrobium faecis]|uniref:hypothetical protein n=1 Tax=Ornithinimicrobium faecis TaxID=2934158 RepID=UPI002118BC38|nr:hypothetical protein [Ornithinimicrobium sp. HY1745]
MVQKRITTILTAAVLAVTFSGCGTEAEPEVDSPSVAEAEETSAPETEESTETAEAAPTTEDAAEDTATEEPSTEEPTTETSAPPTTEDTDEPSSEEAAPTTEAEPEPAPGGNELPTTVEEYADAYLAAGMGGDEELLERMGTDEAVQASVTWTWLEWTGAKVRDGSSEGVVWVSYVGTGHQDNVYGLSLEVDRAAAEAGEDDAVLSGEAGDAMREHTPEEYADELVRLWQAGSQSYLVFLTGGAAGVLEAEPTGGTWERTESTEGGEAALVTYANAETGRELLLTVNIADVEARAQQAVIAAEFQG